MNKLSTTLGPLRTGLATRTALDEAQEQFDRVGNRLRWILRPRRSFVHRCASTTQIFRGTRVQHNDAENQITAVNAARVHGRMPAASPAAISNRCRSMRTTTGSATTCSESSNYG